MTKRFCLELPTPATGFMDSFMLGNGRLGATVAGGIGTERIDINLDCLWSGGPEGEPTGPSPAHLLPDLRQAIATGDMALADALSRHMQGKGWTQSYQPLGVLKFAYAGARDASGYHRQLNLEMASAEHGYGQGDGAVRVRSFVSTSSDVAVVLADGAGLLSPAEMSIAWECQHPTEAVEWVEGAVRWIRITGRAPSMVIPPYVEDDNAIVYASDVPDADGTVAAGMGFAGVAALSTLADGTARVIIAAQCGFRGAFERPSADVAALAAKA
ncbi:MAG: glycoside hydrolase N-terminal domain-containing protein, partial [Cypionkella sp.]